MSLPIVIGLVTLSSVLGAIGLLLFKFGSKKVSLKIKSWILNWNVISGLFLYCIAFIVLVTAMKISDLSVAYPLYALSYIWVALLSHYVLREKIYFKNWIGFILIVIGIALTTIK